MRPTHGAPLTRREMEVAALVAEGLTNKEIADRLFISTRTAESHLEQIRNKLGLHSRARIAVWFAETEPERSTAHASGPSTAGSGKPPEPVRTSRRPRALRAFPLAVAGAIVAIAGIATAVLLARGPVPSSTMSTFAGSGVVAFSADGSSPTRTALARPVAIALDSANRVYFVDGNRIRTIVGDKVITVAGTGQAGYGGDGAIATRARLNSPHAIAFDSQGNLFIADTLNNSIRRVDRNGTISTVAGTGEAGDFGDGGPATMARLNSPAGVAVGFDDTLYIADTGNNRVRQVAPDGTIGAFAGSGEPGYAGDGGPATSAPLNNPQALAFDHEGNLYVTDSLNDRIRKVDLSGVITTFAGTGVRGFAGDGARASSAQLNLSPDLTSAGQTLALDTAGNLYIADAQNHRIRKVALSGLITTVAGSGQPGYTGDGGAATSAALDSPVSIAIDRYGALYVADATSARIRVTR